MKFTGERVIPNKTPKSIFNEHISRYDFAAKFVINKVVLDIACGTGYGSAYLLKKGRAKKVYGGDISPEAINYAKKKYRNKKLFFKVMDATKMPFKNNFFDVIISFETIEHISEYTEFLCECKRVLKKNGRIIISTPNKIVSSPLTKNPCNPFHVKEFYLQEFKEILNNFFVVENIYGQKLIRNTLLFKLKLLICLMIIKIKKVFPKISKINNKSFIKIKRVKRNSLDKILPVKNIKGKTQPTYIIVIAKKK
ncbi:MAG: class I SAM-dependent methyltransferase [Candidatus Pacearchaeota archaeon]